MTRAALLAALLALLVVPAAGADGGLTWQVVSGVAGDSGWYRSSVVIRIQAAQPTTCPVGTDITFSQSSDVLQCTQNGVVFTFQFKIDAVAPTVTGSALDRAPDRNGWYDRPVGVSFSGSDSNSGIASCTSATYSGPDSGSATVPGTCKDNAGNVSAPSSASLKYDATPPSVSLAPARAADANGWFNHAVSVDVQGSDATSGIAGCSPSTSYSGPFTAGTTITGSCTDNAGNSAGGSTAIRFDATPPTAKAEAQRGPDEGGWYHRPVTVSFTGADDGSGLASCSAPQTYSGPDSGAAAISGSCTDNAGNATSASATIRYDATAPRLADVAVRTGDGTALLTWRQPPDTTAVSVVRAPGRDGAASTRVYDGRAGKFTDSGLRPGVAYRYTLASRDQAGNDATTSVTARIRPLLSPAPGAVVRGVPRLRWVAAPGATYYNVQLFRHGRKVLTAWPLGTSYTVPRHWTFEGRRHALARGVYRWYVWPGRGARAKSSYGALLGSSTFRVR